MAEVQASTAKPRPRSVLIGNSESKKVLSPPKNVLVTSPTQKSELSPEDIYCLLTQINTGIPFSGELKVMGFSYQTDEQNEAGWTAMISSSECPEGLFSKVRVSSEGQIKELIDCRTTTREELMVHSGVQGNVVEVPPTSRGEVNLAISGYGFFAVKCGDEIHYVRDGHFIMNDEGQIETRNNCQLISNTGALVSLRQYPQVDDKGCFGDGSCLALVEPGTNDISTLDRYTALATDSPLRILGKDIHLFSNSLEDITAADAGPLGPDWSRLPSFTRPLTCPKLQK